MISESQLVTATLPSHSTYHFSLRKGEIKENPQLLNFCHVITLHLVIFKYLIILIRPYGMHYNISILKIEEVRLVDVR